MKKTQEQKNAEQRARRAQNNNAYTKKYEKTPNGFLMRLYRNMKSRIEGVQKAKHHLYQGKKILPKEEFYEWAKSSPEFWKLFDDWTYHSYKRTMTPSGENKSLTVQFHIDPCDGIGIDLHFLCQLAHRWQLFAGLVLPAYSAFFYFLHNLNIDRSCRV